MYQSQHAVSTVAALPFRPAAVFCFILSLSLSLRSSFIMKEGGKSHPTAARSTKARLTAATAARPQLVPSADGGEGQERPNRVYVPGVREWTRLVESLELQMVQNNNISRETNDLLRANLAVHGQILNSMHAMVMSIHEHHVAGRQEAVAAVYHEQSVSAAQSVAAESHDSSVPSYSEGSWRQDPSLSMPRGGKILRAHSAATREQSADSLSWKRQVATKKRKPD